MEGNKTILLLQLIYDIMTQKHVPQSDHWYVYNNNLKNSLDVAPLQFTYTNNSN